MPIRKSSSSKKGTPHSTNMEGPPRELIVVMKSDAGLRATSSGLSSVNGASVSSLSSLLKSSGAKITPVFGNEERTEFAMSSAPPHIRETVPNLTTFYKVEADDDKLEKIAEKLLNEKVVDGAYVRPRPSLPVVMPKSKPLAGEPPPVTPNFIRQQIYLDAAPAGIDARYAWTVPGGKGEGVRIIDIESAWRFSHEDLIQNQGGVIGGTQFETLERRNHGTAVLGVLGGDENSIGIIGICPQATVRAISNYGPEQSSAKAIRDAADALIPGDIILIEEHLSGPRFDFQDREDQLGYIAVEFWPADFAAIVYAISVRGVIVIEAAGNGAENLDDPLYNTRPNKPPNVFPLSWSNPFNLANPQSGAIIVGAGAPLPSILENVPSFGPDRSRLGFSNFGARVDAQGWGHQVTTTGYGDLQRGSNEDRWYTYDFGGTSSASPIVVGAIACTQGARRAAGQGLLNPATARTLLRTTGSPQQDGLSGPRTQRIGNRPNLREMIIQNPPVARVPMYRYVNPSIGDHFYTTNFLEMGFGSNGWIGEGIQCHVYPKQVTGTVPLYRYLNPSIGDHFYTTNFLELGFGNFGYSSEGIQCYVYPTQVAGTVPLYRYWNPNIGDHFYTTNFLELGFGNFGYSSEGIQCYVFPQPALLLSPEIVSASPWEEKPSADEVASADYSSGSSTGNTVDSLSAIPLTFRTEFTTSPLGTNDPAGYKKSFRTSMTEDSPGQVPRGSSFTTFSASKSSQGKASESSGQVTININVSQRTNDDA